MQVSSIISSRVLSSSQGLEKWKAQLVMTAKTEQGGEEDSRLISGLAKCRNGCTAIAPVEVDVRGRQPVASIALQLLSLWVHWHFSCIEDSPVPSWGDIPEALLHALPAWHLTHYVMPCKATKEHCGLSTYHVLMAVSHTSSWDLWPTAVAILGILWETCRSGLRTTRAEASSWLRKRFGGSCTLNTSSFRP